MTKPAPTADKAGIHTEPVVASAACAMVGTVAAAVALRIVGKVFTGRIWVACTAGAAMKARVTPVTMIAPNMRVTAVSAMLRAIA